MRNKEVKKSLDLYSDEGTLFDRDSELLSIKVTYLVPILAQASWFQKRP